MYRITKWPLIAITATLFLTACEEAPNNRFTLDSAALGAAWPLTVPEVVIFCPQPNAPMLETAEGLIALNGVAMAMKAKGLTVDSSLWKDADDGSGAKASLGPLIERALELCKG